MKAELANEIVWVEFAQNPDLVRRLMGTGDMLIMEWERMERYLPGD